MNSHTDILWHIDSYRHIHIQTHKFTDTSIHIQTQAFIYRYMYSHTDTSIHTQTQSFIYRHILMHRDSYIHIQTHTFIYRHILSHTDTDRGILSWIASLSSICWNFEGLLHWKVISFDPTVDGNIYTQQLVRLHDFCRPTTGFFFFLFTLNFKAKMGHTFDSPIAP